MPPLSLPCSSPPVSPPSGRSAPAVDPCTAVLGALVTGALRLGDVATLPADLLPGELYPVVVRLLAAIAESGRATQGIRLADARRALAGLDAGEALAEQLTAAARAAPKRGEALRALDACRAAWVWPDPVAPAGEAAEAPAAGCEAGAGEAERGAGAEAREEGQAGAGGDAVAVQAAEPVDPGEVAIREAVALARAAWEAAEARWAGRDALRAAGRGYTSRRLP